MKPFTLLKCFLSACALLLSVPSYAEDIQCSSAPSCSDLGYEKNIGTCAKAIACPFDTDYKKCLDCTTVSELCYKYARLSASSDTCSISETSAEYCYKDSCCISMSYTSSSVYSAAPNAYDRIKKGSAHAWCTAENQEKYEEICSGSAVACATGRITLSTCESEGYTIPGTTIPVKSRTFYECGSCDTSKGYYDTEAACAEGMDDSEECVKGTYCYTRKSCDDDLTPQSKCADGYLEGATTAASGLTCGTCKTCNSGEILLPRGEAQPSGYGCRTLSTDGYAGTFSSVTHCCSLCPTGSYATYNECVSNKTDASETCVQNSSNGCYTPKQGKIVYKSDTQYGSEIYCGNIGSSAQQCVSTNASHCTSNKYDAYYLQITTPNGNVLTTPNSANTTLATSFGNHKICLVSTGYTIYHSAGSSTCANTRELKYIHIQQTGAGVTKYYLCPSSSTNDMCKTDTAIQATTNGSITCWDGINLPSSFESYDVTLTFN